MNRSMRRINLYNLYTISQLQHENHQNEKKLTRARNEPIHAKDKPIKRVFGFK